MRNKDRMTNIAPIEMVLAVLIRIGFTFTILSHINNIEFDAPQNTFPCRAGDIFIIHNSIAENSKLSILFNAVNASHDKSYFAPSLLVSHQYEYAFERNRNTENFATLRYLLISALISQYAQYFEKLKYGYSNRRKRVNRSDWRR